MKKTILLAITAMISLASIGQAKKEHTDTSAKKRYEPVEFHTGSKTLAHSKGSDTLVIDSAKTIVVNGMPIDFAVLNEQATQVKQGNIPLYVPVDWIVGMYQYMQTSKNSEFTGAQLDALKMRLTPIVNAILQAQQRNSSPPKQ